MMLRLLVLLTYMHVLDTKRGTSGELSLSLLDFVGFLFDHIYSV